MASWVTERGMEVPDAPTGDAGQRLKQNFVWKAGTNQTASDPTVSSDSTQNYYIGSRWLNTATRVLWTCVDNAAGAAIWAPLFRAASGALQVDDTLQVNVPAAGEKGLIIKAAASQTGSLAEWQNSAGTKLAAVGPDGELNFGAAVQLTIALGAITATKSYHTVETEGGASTDDLDTIGGGTEGDVLAIRPANGSHTVVAKNATGNLRLNGDYSMDEAVSTLTLLFDGSNWLELSRNATIFVAPGTNGQALITQGVGSSPTWAWRSPCNNAFNSDFAIWQRQLTTESTETSYSDDAYSADRWYVLTQTAAIQASRQDGDRARYCGRIKQNQASAQRAGWAQILEGIDSRPFRSQAVRLQCRVKASASQAVRIALIEWTGAEDSPVSDPVNDWTSSTYTTGNFFKSTTTTLVATTAVTPGAATWTDLSVTGTVSSSCTNLIIMVWSEGTMAQNVTLDVTEVSLTLGTEAKLWTPPDPGTEFLRCSRYFYRWQNVGTDGAVLMGGRNGVKQLALQAFPLACRMRTVPTVSWSAPTWIGTGTQTGNQMSGWNETAGADITISGALSIISANPGLTQCWLLLQAATSFSGSAGANCHIRFGGGVYFDFAAEL